MPENFYDINSGVGRDIQNLEVLKKDTNERINALYTPVAPQAVYPDFKVDTDLSNYTVDKRATTNDLVNGKGVTIDDLLTSPDFAKRQFAFNIIGQQADAESSLYLNGVGGDKSVPYDKSMDKYLKGEFGYNPKMDIKGNENFYYENQYMDDSLPVRAVKNVGRFISRVVGQTALKLGENYGLLSSMINPFNFGKGYMQAVADNSITRMFENAEETFKNEWLPVYKSLDYDQKGFFSKLGDATFWTDEVADGAAFMGSMIVDTAIMGGLGKIGMLGKLTSTTIEGTSKFGKFAAGAAKLATGAEDIGGVTGHMRRVVSESAQESSGVFKSVKQDLIDKRKQGLNTYTDEQIDKISGDHAASNFTDNLMILSVSGAVENRFIWQPLKKKFRGISPREEAQNKLMSVDAGLNVSKKTFDYSTKAGKFLDWKNPMSRLQFYGKRAATSTFMEGYWEENAQLASERVNSNKTNYVDELGKEQKRGFWSQLGKQTYDASTWIGGKGDIEASTSIGLGATIGVLGSGLTTKIAGGDKLLQGERRNKLSQRDRQIDSLNKTRTAFLSLNDVYITKEDGSQDLDEDGNLQIDDKKAKVKAAALSKFLNKQIEVDNITNPLLKQHLRNDLLAQYTYAAIKSGLYNQFEDKLLNLPKYLTEVEGLGFDPNTFEKSSDISDAIKEFKTIYDEVDGSKINRPKDITEGDFQKDNDTRKFLLFNTRTMARNASVSAKIAEEAVYTDNKYNPTYDSLAQEYNTLHFQEQGLAQFSQLSKENSSFFTEHIKEQYEIIKKRKAELKESLKDKIASGDFIEDEKQGVIYTPQQAVKTETEQEMFMQQFYNQQKLAQLNNTETQNNFISEKLANTEEGYQNFLDYRNFQKQISLKDNKADQKEEEKTKPTTANPVATPEPEKEKEKDVVDPKEIAKKETISKIKDIFRRLLLNEEPTEEDEALFEEDEEFLSKNLALADEVLDGYYEEYKDKTPEEFVEEFITKLVNNVHPEEFDEETEEYIRTPQAQSYFEQYNAYLDFKNSQTDVISDDEYNDFIDNNKVSEAILQSIADKIKAGTSLSVREQAILAAKNSEIEELLKPITSTNNNEFGDYGTKVGDIDKDGFVALNANVSSNQDAFAISEDQNLFVVGDGLGSYGESGAASRWITQKIAEEIKDLNEITPEWLKTKFEELQKNIPFISKYSRKGNTSSSTDVPAYGLKANEKWPLFLSENTDPKALTTIVATRKISVDEYQIFVFGDSPLYIIDKDGKIIESYGADTAGSTGVNAFAGIDKGVARVQGTPIIKNIKLKIGEKIVLGSDYLSDGLVTELDNLNQLISEREKWKSEGEFYEVDGKFYAPSELSDENKETYKKNYVAWNENAEEFLNNQKKQYEIWSNVFSLSAKELEEELKTLNNPATEKIIREALIARDRKLDSFANMSAQEFAEKAKYTHNDSWKDDDATVIILDNEKMNEIRNIKSEAKSKTVVELRADEQAEYDAMSDPKDEVKRKEIYDRYDKLITPALIIEKANIERRRQEAKEKEQAEWDSQTPEYKKLNENFNKRIPIREAIDVKYDAELDALKVKKKEDQNNKVLKSSYSITKEQLQKAEDGTEIYTNTKDGVHKNGEVRANEDAFFHNEKVSIIGDGTGADGALNTFAHKMSEFTMFVGENWDTSKSGEQILDLINQFQLTLNPSDYTINSAMALGVISMVATVNNTEKVVILLGDSFVFINNKVYTGQSQIAFRKDGNNTVEDNKKHLQIISLKKDDKVLLATDEIGKTIEKNVQLLNNVHILSAEQLIKNSEILVPSLKKNDDITVIKVSDEYINKDIKEKQTSFETKNYEIEKRDDGKWYVFTKDGGKLIGVYQNKDEALDKANDLEKNPPQPKPPVKVTSVDSEEETIKRTEKVIDKQIDQARIDGKFLLPGSHLQEVVRVDTDKKVVVLKSSTDPNFERHHNFLKRLEQIPSEEIKFQLVPFGSVKEFMANPSGKDLIGNVAVIVDKDGNQIKFSQDGLPDNNGKPIAFQFYINEYKTDNLNIPRQVITSQGEIQADDIVNGFINNNPLKTLNQAVNSKNLVYGTVLMSTNGLLSALDSNNALSQNKNSNVKPLTMRELMDLGYISGDPKTLMSGQETFFIQNQNLPITFDAVSQQIKVGQVIVSDPKSGVHISFNGVAFKDIKVHPDNKLFKEINKALAINDGEISFNSPDEAAEFLDFFQQVFYYTKGVKFTLEGEKIKYEVLDLSKTPLTEIKINYNELSIDGSTGHFELAKIQIPGDPIPINYIDFVKDNFVTKSIPALGANGQIQFEKLNKRLIFAVDKSQADMMNDMHQITTKVNTTDYTKFVGKTFKTPTGNTMTIVSFENGVYTVKNQDGEEKTMTGEVFIKSFSKLQEIIKTTPDEESLQQFQETKLTKEKFNTIMNNLDQYDEDTMDFGC